MAEAARGLAVVCGADGALRELVRDDVGLAPRFEAGGALADLFDPGSHRKLDELLAGVERDGFALDVELVARCGERALPLRFAAARADGTVLLVGARSRRDLVQLCEYGSAAAGRHAPQFADLCARLSATGAPGETDVWDAFTRLYHDFARLQRELAQQNEALRRAHEEKDRVMRTVAHDLRGPLSAIRYNLEYLSRALAGRLATRERESLERLRDVSARMARLLDELLVTSGPAAVSTPALRRQPVALDELLAGTVQLCEPMAARKRIGVVLRADTVMPPVAADRDRLQQVVLNLIDNALKFSPPGGTVSVSLARREREAVVCVRDQGPGIPPAERQRVFEPYARGSARPTAGEPSTGLGLAICRSLVEAHGGRIWVEHAPDGGAAVCFTLPLTGQSAASEGGDARGVDPVRAGEENDRSDSRTPAGQPG